MAAAISTIPVESIALPPGAEDAWSGLKFDAQGFDEIVDLGAGQHLVPTIPKRAWRTAADGALRVLERRSELFPAAELKHVSSYIDAGLMTAADAKTVRKIRCNGSAHPRLVVMQAHSERRIPKMTSLKQIRAYRAKRKALRARLQQAWAAVPLQRKDFACVMGWVQEQLAVEIPAGLPVGATVTRLQQRRWDAHRIAASLFLQALDPHCNLYPNRLFEAQETAASTSKPVTVDLLLPKKQKIAVMRVHQFATGTAKQARQRLDELQRKTPGGLRGLVLDMRGNTGGWVDEALEFADLFLGDAVVTAVHDRKKIEKKRSKTEKTDFLAPTVVLIDARCRSSCELVSAALHENNRAVVVGARSFGKATVQGVFDAQEGPWSVFVTIARYHGPRGESLQRWGVTPDVKITPMMTAGAKVWRESRFEKALAPPRQQPPYRSPLLSSPAVQKCYKRVRRCDPSGMKKQGDGGAKDLGLCVAMDYVRALPKRCK